LTLDCRLRGNDDKVLARRPERMTDSARLKSNVKTCVFDQSGAVVDVQSGLGPGDPLARRRTSRASARRG
jgi:hypothetical protein